MGIHVTVPRMPILQSNASLNYMCNTFVTMIHTNAVVTIFGKCCPISSRLRKVASRENFSYYFHKFVERF